MRRCLRKDPAQRLQHLGDARLEIEEARAEPEGASGIAVPSRNPSKVLTAWALLGDVC